MMTIKLLFFLFLPQIQILTFFPKNRKSRCINLPMLVLGSTSTSWRWGKCRKSQGALAHASHLKGSTSPGCIQFPSRRSWAFGRGVSSSRNKINFLARRRHVPQRWFSSGSKNNLLARKRVEFLGKVGFLGGVDKTSQWGENSFPKETL